MEVEQGVSEGGDGAALALRHGADARTRAARVPGLDGVASREIRHVAVVGGGLMGTAIAVAILNAGLCVTLIEPRDDARARASGSIAKAIRRDAAPLLVELVRAGRDFGSLNAATTL